MRSIKRRLTLGFLGVFVLLAAALLGALYWAMRAALLAQFDATLRVKALVVMTATDQKRGKLDVSFSVRYLPEFDQHLATDFYQLWVYGGDTAKRSISLGRTENLPQRFGSLDAPEYWDLPLPIGRGPGRAIGIRFRPRFDPRDPAPQVDPVDAVIVVASHRGQLDALLRRVAVVLAAGGLAFVLATSLTVPLVLRPGLRPIRRVASLAQEIDVASLAQRFPTTGVPDELLPICERLNDLLTRLEASFAREHRFSADLAHQLLTPLAEMRAIAETALKWPEAAGQDDYRRSLEIMQRMQRLVEHLLELARAEAGGQKTRITLVDAGEILSEIVRAHAVEATRRRLEFAMHGPEPFEFDTDAGALRGVLDNLIGNAVVYAPEGSTITMQWKMEPGMIELSVGNPAPEVQPEDLPRLFERFWRKGSSGTGPQHSGLGLSVASELAKALGGTLAARKSDEGDLIFTLQLPSQRA